MACDALLTTWSSRWDTLDMAWSLVWHILDLIRSLEWDIPDDGMEHSIGCPCDGMGPLACNVFPSCIFFFPCTLIFHLYIQLLANLVLFIWLNWFLSIMSHCTRSSFHPRVPSEASLSPCQHWMNVPKMT